ncbi:MAG: 3-deoxy-manno-octulosonate cytidylyltransferase, partial [Bacteroidota bacterium]
MKVLAIIPARYASTRFPAKALAMIGKKSMIQRVYEQVIATSVVDKVIIATDDTRIFKHVQTFGGQVEMTASTHPSGTDRCAEVAARHPEFECV